MAKDEQTNQLNLTVVALVALVAIVGLVALVMSAASAKTAQLASGSKLATASDTTNSELNMVGNAERAPLQQEGAPADCYQGSNGMICPGLNDRSSAASGGSRSAGALCNGATAANQCGPGLICVGYPVGTCQPSSSGGGSAGASPPSSCKPLGEYCTRGPQCCSKACNRNTCT